MKNIDFQKNLKYFPDGVEVYVDTLFGWNAPSNKGYKDPYIHAQTDESGYITQLEIAPEDYAPMNLETIKLIVDIMKEEGMIDGNIDLELILEKFREKYE